MLLDPRWKEQKSIWTVQPTGLIATSRFVKLPRNERIPSVTPVHSPQSSAWAKTHFVSGTHPIVMSQRPPTPLPRWLCLVSVTLQAFGRFRKLK